MTIESLPPEVRKQIEQIRAQNAEKRKARQPNPTLRRIAVDTHEPLPLKLFKKVGFDLEMVGQNRRKRIQEVRAFIDHFLKQPLSARKSHPAIPMLAPAPAPGPPQPQPQPQPQSQITFVKQCILASGSADSNISQENQLPCIPDGDIKTNTMHLLSEHAGFGECCSRAQARPSDVESDIWFYYHPPTDDGFVTFVPFVHLFGRLVLFSQDDWYAPGHGEVYLNMQTIVAQTSVLASSWTTLINESGSNIQIAYNLDDEYVLPPVTAYVQGGSPVLMTFVADGFANSTRDSGIGILDLCRNGGGIQVQFVEAIWQPVPIIM